MQFSRNEKLCLGHRPLLIPNRRRRRLLKQLLHIGKDQIRRALAVDLLDQVLRLVVVDDGQGVVDEGLEPLLQTLLVVVGPVAAQATPQAPLHAHLLLAAQHQHELQVHLRLHLLVPPVQVVLVPRESVDQEVVLLRVLQ